MGKIGRPKKLKAKEKTKPRTISISDKDANELISKYGSLTNAYKVLLSDL